MNYILTLSLFCHILYTGESSIFIEIQVFVAQNRPIEGIFSDENVLRLIYGFLWLAGTEKTCSGV